MPIANCFIKSELTSILNHSKIVEDWAKSIGLETKDITINLISDFVQIGKTYEIMVNLYLPSHWSDENIKNIQVQLLNILIKHFNLKTTQIFILTNIIQSGHVLENGKVAEW